jgi:hypothetical protein
MSRYQPTKTHTDGLIVIEGRPGDPLIVIAPMEHYRTLLACDCLNRTTGAAYYVESASLSGAPIVYSGETHRPAPVRLRSYRPVALAPSGRIIVITRAGRPLSPDEARALERFGWNQVIASGRAEPANDKDAFGASLGDDGYKALQAFWAKALVWLHPHCSWLAPQLLPPFYLEEPRSSRTPLGQVLTLRRGRLTASVELVEDGFVLLPDSIIRRRVVATASVTASVLREELWAWGALEAVEDPSLWRLTRRVQCRTLSAAFLLVLGYRGGRTDAWMRDSTTLAPSRPAARNNILLFPSWRVEMAR